MAKSKRDELMQILVGYVNTINDTLQLFEQTPPPTQDKLIWNDVLQLSDYLSKQATIDPECGAPNSDEDDDDDDDLGDDLSPEELEVSKTVADVVSETLMVIKELICVITGMIKLENPKDNGEFVDLLEKLLKLCQGTGVLIDDLGACVYPPQELNLMKQRVESIRTNICEIEADVESFKNSSSKALLGTCRRLQSLIEHMETELDTRIEAEVVCKMQNATL